MASLRFKWLELDHVFWRVLGLSSNENEPFSLHANGAFALVGQEILSESQRSVDWTADLLEGRMKETMQRSYERSLEVSSQIKTIHAYQDFIEQEHLSFLARHPGAVVNVWKEALLVAMLSGNHARAAQIARSCIDAHDSGGYYTNGKSFFEHALLACEALSSNLTPIVAAATYLKR